jgi:diaminopimelate epimerase
MDLIFYKYQGTGNDFIMVDNRNSVFDKTNLSKIKQLCDRKFGIGADGLILIEDIEDFDFNMLFFNPDGTQSFCGNGSRCAVAFAQYLGIIDSKAVFLSNDGEHEAWINKNGEVSLKMQDVSEIEKGDGYYYINTGSPHYISLVEDVKDINVKQKGASIRYNERFNTEGTNVNFVRFQEMELDIRTYERGVEDETLSCGTGVTAAALCMAYENELQKAVIYIKAVGGNLKVSFNRNGTNFNDIWLIGPATYVFNGTAKI